MGAEARDDEAPDWQAGPATQLLPAEVRRAFPPLDVPFEIRPLPGGNLHRSFHVRTADAEYVLQRVSDVFAPAIHDNIVAVSRHLERHGFRTIRLLPTREGEPCLASREHGRWRLMPHLGGARFRRLRSVPQARSAGRLAGRFHAAMADFEGELAPMGIPYRDTPRYLRALRDALATHAGHRLAAEMKPLGERVLAAFDALGSPPGVGERVIHGDLKLDNLLFEGEQPPARDRAFALIDLDTLMRAPLWVELGDAWRSWCNPAGEHTRETRFEIRYFEASAEGFLDGLGEPLAADELASLETATERVCLELCARYVTDALEETYFNWDAERFETRGEHNLVRAFGQWNYYEAVRACEDERKAILERLGRRA